MVQLIVTAIYLTGKNLALVANLSTFYTRDDRGRKFGLFWVHCAERALHCQQQLTNRLLTIRQLPTWCTDYYLFI